MQEKAMKARAIREMKYHLVGWGLFILCAFFFIAASARNGDTLTFVGSIVFFVACLAFVIPLYEKYKDANKTMH